MIVPQAEITKMIALNAELHRFHGLYEKIQFKSIYREKFDMLLQTSIKKIVGCKERIRLNPQKDDDGKVITGHNYRWGGKTAYVLTREGIKEEFGYTGELKCRIPTNSNWAQEYVADKKITAALIKLVGSKEIQNQDALKEHIQLRKDLEKLSINDGEYAHIVTLATPIVVQECMSVHTKGTDEPRFTTDTIFVTLEHSWGEDDFNMVDGKVTEKAERNYRGNKEYKFDHFHKFSQNMDFETYLRYSEPATYDVILKLVRDEIALVNQYIIDSTKKIEAMLEKYGHLVVFTTL